MHEYMLLTIGGIMFVYAERYTEINGNYHFMRRETCVETVKIDEVLKIEKVF